MNFQQFTQLRLSSAAHRVWGCMWVAIIGDLWKQKNMIVFKNGRVDHLEIFMLAQLKVLVMDYIQREVGWVHIFWVVYGAYAMPKLS